MEERPDEGGGLAEQKTRREEDCKHHKRMPRIVVRDHQRPLGKKARAVEFDAEFNEDDSTDFSPEKGPEVNAHDEAPGSWNLDSTGSTAACI